MFGTKPTRVKAHPQIVIHLALSRLGRSNLWVRDQAEVLRLRKKVRGTVFNRKVSSQAGINLVEPRGMSSHAGSPHGAKDH